jgi:hypothetical protein
MNCRVLVSLLVVFIRIGAAIEIFSFLICKSVVLDFAHRLYFKKITTFRKLDLLPSSGKKKGRIETLAVGSPG